MATKNLSSLFIGRWQPFHEGHKTLIETVLKKGKPVVIGIRDTEMSHNNPYSIHERWSFIQREFIQYGDLVKIIVVPDFDEICYGRDVGYKIRQIDLEKDVENISGTKIREANSPTKEIIWLTGNSGAGKSTLGKLLEEKIGAVMLDGDEMRESISVGTGFSKDDREEHNLRVARLAKVLARHSPVVVSVIAPFASTRKKIDDLIKPTWVYIKRTLPKDKDKPYEPPKSPDVVVDFDKISAEEGLELFMKYYKK